MAFLPITFVLMTFFIITLVYTKYILNLTAFVIPTMTNPMTFVPMPFVHLTLAIATFV